MLVKENNKNEINEKLNTFGDYVKMEYLSNCLKKPLDYDTRRFVLTKLAELNESKKMYLAAGKMMRSAGDINVTSQAKINDFVKSAGLFIKAGNYDEADVSASKAISIANGQQKEEIKNMVKEIYKNQAGFHKEKDQKKQEMEVYEKLLTFGLDENERNEVQNRLMTIYENLGKMREYFSLKRSRI
ncbi:MAG: hypothetical protein AABX73_04260 [Nanoarchaeota archaeon]